MTVIRAYHGSQEVERHAGKLSRVGGGHSLTANRLSQRQSHVLSDTQRRHLHRVPDGLGRALIISGRIRAICSKLVGELHNFINECTRLLAGVWRGRRGADSGGQRLNQRLSGGRRRVDRHVSRRCGDRTGPAGTVPAQPAWGAPQPQPQLREQGAARQAAPALLHVSAGPQLSQEHRPHRLVGATRPMSPPRHAAEPYRGWHQTAGAGRGPAAA